MTWRYCVLHILDVRARVEDRSGQTMDLTAYCFRHRRRKMFLTTVREGAEHRASDHCPGERSKRRG